MSHSNDDDGNPPPIHNRNDEHRDSTMLLANVSEQYGSSIPSTRFARRDYRGSDETEKRENVDTGATKHLQLPLFLSSKLRDRRKREVISAVKNYVEYLAISFLSVLVRLQRHFI